MPILEVKTNFPPSIFKVLVDYLPGNVVLDDIVQTCQEFEENYELYEIQIFMNATRPNG
jgi:hypothetical protein